MAIRGANLCKLGQKKNMWLKWQGEVWHLSHWSRIEGKILDKQDFEKWTLFITLNGTSCSLHMVYLNVLGDSPFPTMIQKVLILLDESDSIAISV